MRIAIIGAGYVGLVTGACLARLGHDIVCVDRDAARVAALDAGATPIYEPGLDEIIRAERAAGRLRFATNGAEATNAAQIVFIAVGTPTADADGEADLRGVLDVAREIAAVARQGLVVVMKSTAPVGSAEAVHDFIARIRPSLDFAVVSNPEFLREGAAVRDFMHPDRIIIGADEPWAGGLVASLYAPLAERGARMVMTDRRSAEAIKYASNAFLAMKVAFINEMADFCEASGAAIGEVARGIGSDRRIGEAFLQPGPGFGGSCFPKDLRALAHSARRHGVALRLVESATAVNEARKTSMARRIVDTLGGEVAGKTIAVLGLTFKEDTDDVRESPALVIASLLRDAGAHVVAYDPKGGENARRALPGVEFARDAYDCAAGADALVVATGWREFAALDPVRLAATMRGETVFDLRNLLDANALTRAGLIVYGVGRPPARPVRRETAAGTPHAAEPAF